MQIESFEVIACTKRIAFATVDSFPLADNQFRIGGAFANCQGSADGTIGRGLALRAFGLLQVQETILEYPNAVSILPSPLPFVLGKQWLSVHNRGRK